MADKFEPVTKKRAWLRYDETSKAQDANIVPQDIAKAHDLLEIAKELQPNLAFPRKVVTEFVAELVRRNQDSYGIKPDEINDYQSTMVCRFMNIMRAVSQGLAKTPRPTWVKLLPWMVDGGVKGSPIKEKI